MSKVKMVDVCEAVGLVCVSVGCFFVALSVGFIVTGFSLVCWGIATGRKR